MSTLFLKELLEKATKLNKHVILCEGEDSRVVEASAKIIAQNLAKITLLGNREQIIKENPTINLAGINIIDPKTSEKRAEYAKLLFELRKEKGLTREQAEELSYDNTYFGMLMLKAGDADGVVSGACHSTANILRPALQIIKTAKGVPLVSACFVMIAPEGGNQYCKDGAFIFGDCGLNESPNSEQLADIAYASAQTAKAIVGVEPNIAMLSFSTKGSAKHPEVQKVIDATKILKERYPYLNVDGELQFDASLVPTVAKLKAPDSLVAGTANVFIFPDLSAGNIGYKIAERLGGFQAVGPICQGFAKPVNDLSRGCKVDDIVAAVAITALQTQF